MKKPNALTVLLMLAVLCCAAVPIAQPIFQRLANGTPSSATRVVALPGDASGAPGQQAQQLTLPQLAQWEDADPLNPQKKREWLMRAQTLDATPAVLNDSLAGGAGIAMPSGEESLVLLGHLVGRRGETGESRAWQITAVVRTVGATTSLQNFTATSLHADPNTAAWTVTAAINGHKLEVTVTAANGQQVMWSGYCTAVSSMFTSQYGARCWDSFLASNYGWSGRQLLAYYDGDQDGMPTIVEYAHAGNLNGNAPVPHQAGTGIKARIANEDLWITRIRLRGLPAEVTGNLIEGRNFQCLRVVAEQSLDLMTWSTGTEVFQSDTLDSAIAEGEIRNVACRHPIAAANQLATVDFPTSYGIQQVTQFKFDSGAVLALPNYPYDLPAEALQLEADLIAAGVPATVTGNAIHIAETTYHNYVVSVTVRDVTQTTTDIFGNVTPYKDFLGQASGVKTLGGVACYDKQFVRFRVSKL